MTKPIRSTRLEVPVDASGVPIMAAASGDGNIAKTVRSYRLDWPVDGNGMPLVNVQGVGNGSGTSDHAALTNRDAAAQHPASAIAAADGKSVQEHIDKIGTIPTNFAQILDALVIEVFGSHDALNTLNHQKEVIG